MAVAVSVTVEVTHLCFEHGHRQAGLRPMGNPPSGCRHTARELIKHVRHVHLSEDLELSGLH